MSSELENALQRRREDARRDVLAWLAMRAPNAFRCAAIRQRVNRDNGTDYREEEVFAALAFRMGTLPPEVERILDPVGTDHGYRASTAGQLNYERGNY